MKKLHIAGGTYWERCLFPDWNELFGSGLRAAIAVRSLGTDVHFHTYISDNLEEILRARAAGKFGLTCKGTSPTVCFKYNHGFSRPHITPPVFLPYSDTDIGLSVKADYVLRYGFLEGHAKVDGKRVVYDPQNPWRPESFTANGSSAKSLALVVNRSEARLLSGELTPEAMAATLMIKQGAEVVIVKCGSRGCLITEAGTTTWIPPYRTNFVWPVGSGDMFSAVFANYWACHELRAADAADAASKATALYCNSMNAELPANFLQDFPFPPVLVKEGPQKRVYLAGPFFNIGQRWLIEEAKAALEDQGLSVFSPYHDVGWGNADAVYGPDIRGVESCDVVFACVDGLDAGTLYEIGYAHSRQKPVVVLVQNERREDLKMLEGGGCVIESDFVTAIYKTVWLITT